MKLNLKIKTIISIVAFVLIFVGLILIASFLDFQVSGILTKGVLAEGEYFATDFFGVMLESVGCIPIYLFIAFALCVLFWSSLKIGVPYKSGGKWNTKKPVNIVCAVICAIGVVAACWYAIKDSVGYIFEHTLNATGDIAGNLEALDKFEHSAAVYGVEAVFGLIMGALAIVATMHFNVETLKKLLKYVLAAACAVLLANVLIMIIKDPIGRMRFRAINSTLGAGYIESGEVQGYTPWYVINHQPSKEILAQFKSIYGVKDAFKSFPSGHTCSAGTLYTLIMIPTLFGWTGNKKKLGATIACWVVPIVYTGLVAISRIMVGAHYMSDVTFGGTLAFVCAVIMWEIFICKGSHFFALFPNARKKATVKAEAEQEEIAANTQESIDVQTETAMGNNDGLQVEGANNVQVNDVINDNLT